MNKEFTLAQLAEHFDLSCQGDPGASINGVATLQKAKSTDLAFLFNPSYKKHLAETQAGVVVLSEELAKSYVGNCLVSSSPYYHYAQIANLFKVEKTVANGVHSTVVMGNDCQIAKTAKLGVNVVLGDRVRIGEHVSIAANTVIEDDVTVGDHTVIWPNVTIGSAVDIGRHCEILSGAVIGSDGFGYAMHEGKWHKVPQLGSVILGDHVSVGANTSIDRGSIEDTVIEEGVKLDNQIQIAHNVHVGAHTVAAGCVGIAGSARIGKYCQIGGGAGITGHIDIADQVAISAMSMIPKSISEPGMYSGRDLGLLPLKEWQKKIAQLRQIDKWVGKIKVLEAIKVSNKKVKSNNHQQENISMNKLLDINDIIQLIPHRYPFLLVDRVVDYELGKSLVAIKNVTANEQFFTGHFPQRPVMPGVLIVEALAQAGAVLAFKTTQELNPDDDAEILFLAGVDNARFKRVVEPGDQLKLEVEVLKSKGKIWKLKGTATVNGELACAAEILSAK